MSFTVCNWRCIKFWSKSLSLPVEPSPEELTWYWLSPTFFMTYLAYHLAILRYERVVSAQIKPWYSLSLLRSLTRSSSLINYLSICFLSIAYLPTQPQHRYVNNYCDIDGGGTRFLFANKSFATVSISAALSFILWNLGFKCDLIYTVVCILSINSLK